MQAHSSCLAVTLRSLDMNRHSKEAFYMSSFLTNFPQWRRIKHFFTWPCLQTSRVNLFSQSRQELLLTECHAALNSVSYKDRSILKATSEKPPQHMKHAHGLAVTTKSGNSEEDKNWLSAIITCHRSCWPWSQIFCVGFKRVNGSQLLDLPCNHNPHPSYRQIYDVCVKNTSRTHQIVSRCSSQYLLTCLMNIEDPEEHWKNSPKTRRWLQAE